MSGPLKFKRDSDGDYSAEREGVTYEIVKSSDAGFGLSIRAPEHLRHIISDDPYTHGIAWLRTKYRCEQRANKIADQIEATKAGKP